MPLAIVRLVLKRLANNRALVSTAVLGLLVAVTLVAAVPLYAEGISGLLLQRELREGGQQQAQPTSSVFIRHFDDDDDVPTPPEEYRAFDRFFRELIPGAVGLPTTELVSYLATAKRQLLDLSPAGVEADADSIRRIDFGYVFNMDGLFDNAAVMEGRRPVAERTTMLAPTGAPVLLLEGAMTTAAMDRLGLVLGDRVGLRLRHPDTAETLVAAIKIVGRIAPLDTSDNYWLYRPKATLDNGGIYVEREAFLDGLVAEFPWEFHEATWYADFDLDAIRAANYRNIIGGLQVIRINVDAIYPNTKLEGSPEPVFFDFEQRLFVLRLLLIIFSAPIVAIVLYYIGLASTLAVDRQRNEIAILKSRGVGTPQIIGIYVFEGALIGGIAAAAGPYLGSFLAQLIGKTFTFLVFTNREPLPIEIAPIHFAWSGGAAALAILATLLPAIGAARHSIVTYKQEVSRQTRRPWYQRYFVDLLLLAVSIYGYVTLAQRDTLFALGDGGELFSDPLLIVVPIVFMFAVALVFLRVFPWIVAGLSRAGDRLWGVAAHLGLRQLSRDPGQYTRLILLLMLTLALGTFSASMAATLDQNLDDRVLHGVGADAFFLEGGEFDEVSQAWSMLPVENHLEVPQILGVARLWRSGDGNNEAGFRAPGESLRRDVVALGVDPLDFARIVWWRDDYAPDPLNALMNQLALDEQALIASRELFADTLGMAIGDQLRLEFGVRELEFFIAGWTDLFPTHFPEDGPFVVVNLDYVQRNVGESPWDILARTDPESNATGLRYTLLLKRFKVFAAADARAEIVAGRDDSSRIGIFGILSIGFLVAAALTLLGFVTYSYISFRRRMQQLGILRAMGLSVRQLVGLYAFENGFLIVLGVAVGTGIGALAGTLFIPFMQLSADRFGDTPPFVVITAWDQIAKIYAVFGAVVLAAFPLSAWLLAKIRVSEAVKFGEEQG